MKSIHLFLLFIFGLFANPHSVFAADSLSHKVQKMEAYSQENYHEVVYIQTDKQYYMAGEQVRFTVFCLERSTSKPSQLSKVAYFEVLDMENSPQFQARILLQEGIGYGEASIPISINSGNFILRGYTRWMRNYGPETYFHSSITIINPFKKLGLKPIPEPTEVSINFYPESGTIIHGVKTKIVFDCKNAMDYPVDFVGKLFANDSILIKEFKPNKNGIGDFEFIPNIDSKYYVELTPENGTITKHDFPATEAKGFSMHIEEKEDNFMVEIYCNDNSIGDPTTSLFYIVHKNGIVKDKNQFVLQEGMSTLELSKAPWEEGVSVISIFSYEGKLLKEKQVFYYLGKDDLPIKINSTSFNQREKVAIDILNPGNGLPASDLNLSISAASHHTKFDNQNLCLSFYLLLGNSMKGFVYGLETYFAGSKAEVSRNINNLLVAYSNETKLWNNLEHPPEINYIPEYRKPLVTGQLTNKITKEPANAIFTYLSVPGKNIRFNATKSKRNGSFTFELAELYGINEIVVQTDYTKDTIYSINMNDPFSQEYAVVSLPIFDLDEQMGNWIKRQSQNFQIENANKNFQPKLPLITKMDSSSFYNEPDARYYLDDFTRFIVMEEVMREYVYGVNVRKNREGFHFMVLDMKRNEIFSENPLILLDGVPVFDADEIIALDPLNVEKIETVKTRFHKGFLDCRGIVTYTTYKGDLNGYSLHDDALVFEYVGVQTRKQYYFPEYSSSFERKATTPDFRNVLYWNPEIRVDKNGDSTVEFYTSDDVTDYEIRINGISDNGEAFSKNIYFEVQPPNPN